MVFGVILVVLLVCFSARRVIVFYFRFEAVLIPIFLVIMGWGYQPERLRASLYMFFYTLTASLPLLMRVVIVIVRGGRSRIGCLMGGVGNFSEIFIATTMRAFMVKFPIYLFHL